MCKCATGRNAGRVPQCKHTSGGCRCPIHGNLLIWHPDPKSPLHQIAKVGPGSCKIVVQVAQAIQDYLEDTLVRSIHPRTPNHCPAMLTWELRLPRNPELNTSRLPSLPAYPL